MQAVKTLLGDLRIPYRTDEPLAPLTTFRIGGPARYLVFPESFEQVSLLLCRLREMGIPPRILGRGANLLLPDAGLDVVVSLGRWKRISFDGPRVEVEAGYSLPLLIQQAALRGLSGLEGLGGIPASVGGALAMNAGGRFGDISQSVKSLTIAEPDGCIRTLRREEVPFGYRTSGLPDAVFLSCVLELREDDPARVRRELQNVASHKRLTQPLHERSAGCIFKNPPGESAGRLIEQAGLKGERRGGAVVSSRHANFIVNQEGASSADVLRLIDHVRDTVARRFAVELGLEIKIW